MIIKGLVKRPILMRCFCAIHLILSITIFVCISQLKRTKMLFIAVFLILLFNSASAQSIFEPYTFTEGSCNGARAWTMWFDTNDPNLTQGDVEITSHIQQLFPTFMCSSPTGIEVCLILLYYILLKETFISSSRLKLHSIPVQQRLEMYSVSLSKMDFYV